MFKKIALTAGLLIAGAVPAFAEDSCPVPPVPAVVDGATVAKDQLLAAIKATKDYLAASDTYQDCIGTYLADQKAAAEKAKTPPDTATEAVETGKIQTNQDNKQKVGDAINAAIGAYKKAHPT